MSQFYALEFLAAGGHLTLNEWRLLSEGDQAEFLKAAEKLRLAHADEIAVAVVRVRQEHENNIAIDAELDAAIARTGDR